MAEKVERRLAAILAMDVVGFSTMMAANETDTLAHLQTLRGELIDPTLAVHRGRVVKLMGDGALVEFASIVDAVQCAVEVQRLIDERNQVEAEAGRIDLRIGINLGDVIVDGDDIYGDGVNIAARLEPLSEPGGIVVSASAFEQAKNKVDIPFEDLGPQQLKNIPEPVRAYSITPNSLGAAGAAPTRPNIQPRQTAIAVLPFANLSGEREQEYFADGLTEDIITALSACVPSR